MLVEAVIVAGDRAGADIGARADARIADISEMIDLGALGDLGLLDLDEIADVRALGEVCAGPQPRERADGRVIADAGAFEYARRL